MGHETEHAHESTHASKGGRGKLVALIIFVAILAGGLWFGFRAYGNACPDTDGDGLDDCAEMNTYFTDHFNSDTDGDGYPDGQEVAAGYSPHRAQKRLSQVDSDGDGLTDDKELAFTSNLNISDTDGDGYPDGQEVAYGYSPTTKDQKRLEKRIEISIEDQRLRYYLAGVELGEFVVSTGKNDTTPRGTFAIDYKHPRAWSRTAQLWMPYWMSFKNNKYGIHELPEWPSGEKEGEENLGVPASGGCIRLGEDSAKFLYEWTPLKTKVKIF